MVAIRVPPGRAGRLWLRGRLAAAERAADLLEHKARLLRTEHRRYADAARRDRLEWTTALRAADEWTLRATILAGERGLLFAATPEQATVDVQWATLMGVRYPRRTTCSWPVHPGPAVRGSAAHVAGRTAHRAALEAAVRLAADDAALRALTTELAATNRRIRALRRRWIPALRRELARVELMLEELDRAEATVRRRAAAQRTAPAR